METTLTYNLDEIGKAAEFVIEHSKGYTILLLDGTMGAGKTTLTSAICSTLGVKDAVGSPTFSIVNEYVDRDDQTIYHFDFYRLEDEEEAMLIGAEEYFYSGNLCIIEWASRVENILPDEFILVSLSIEDSKTRKINISYGR